MTQAALFTMVYIFFARILDVSIGTMRIVLISRGYRYVAPLLGFVEVLIWLTAISKALASLESAYSYLIYAAGFAAGNYVGMLLEAKLPFGYKSLRVITTKEVSALPLMLRDEGFGVTISEGAGLKGPVLHTLLAGPEKEAGAVPGNSEHIRTELIHHDRGGAALPPRFHLQQAVS